MAALPPALGEAPLTEGDIATDTPTPAPKAATLTLRIVRHGVTAWNAEGRLQGHTNVPLAPEGREQARRLGLRLAAAAAPDSPESRFSSPPDLIYTSDLSRAIETAAIAMENFLMPPSSIRVTDRLRERSFGPWEGLTFEEARLLFGPSRSHRDEGESKSAVWARMEATLSDMWNEGTDKGTKDGHIMVVGHGGSLREFVCLAVGLPPSAAHHFYLDNTGLSILELQGTPEGKRQGKILLWNDTAHLFYSQTPA